MPLMVPGQRARFGRRVSGRMIGQYHLVLIFLMFEKVIDTFFFQQAADEIEIGLTVLNTIFPFLIAISQLGIHLADVVLAQEFADQIRHGHVLPDARRAP